MSYKSDRLAECLTETERLHVEAFIRRTGIQVPCSLGEEDKFSKVCSAHLDGLQVTLFRSDFDGKIVVDIETHDLKERDVHPGDAVPDIRVAVNGYSSSILPDGTWSVDEPLWEV